MTSQPGRAATGCTGNCDAHAPLDEVCDWCARHAEPGREATPREDAVMDEKTPHVPLDLSFPFNEGEPPQCWKCGLPWPSEGTCTGTPNPEQLASMLEDPDTWAQGLATEVRRLHGMPDV